MSAPTKFDLPKKPHYRLLAEELDLFELFKKLASRSRNCFLFESLGEEGDASRYSILGFDPEAIFIGNDGELTIEQDGERHQLRVENPYYALREYLPQTIISREYAGGLVGYLAYEAMKFFEPTLHLSSHPSFDLFRFGLYTDGLLFDKLTGETNYFYYNKDRSELIREIIESPPPLIKTPTIEFLGDSLQREEHEKVVLKVKEDIRAGRIYQAEVGYRSDFRIRGDKLPIYERLREVNPSPYMFYVKLDTQELIGASPELLFKLRDGEMTVAPLAGSAPRGSNEAEDRRLARGLLRDEKERAEHAMLVDLHRNDVGRVAEFGSVRVRDLMNLKKLSFIQHICSEVVGTLKKGEDMFSALASNFPMGTVTGAPKIEAMKIIEENEGAPRGPYAGGVGHFGLNGDCTFAVQLRTLFCSGESAYIQTCGGNVFDSDPAAEYDEIQRKLSGMKRVLQEFSSVN